ncbi:MAG: tetratricopeptide repeat protein, partial [Bacteroidota bacterium]
MPFRVKFAIGFLLLSIQCFAQRNETDSLESLVRSVSPDTTKVWLLNNLVTSLREKDNNKALRFAQQAKQLAELLSYKKGLAQALENLGWILFRQGDYSKSFQLSTQALRISEDLQDKSAIARCLINIAAINYEQKQYTLAIENFKKAYQVAKMVDDHRTMARSLNNIAFTFLRSARQLDSAYAYARESFAVSKRIGDPYMIGFSTHTLGDIDLESGNAKLALKNFNDCLIIAEQHHINFLKVSSLYRLGRAYKILKQPGKTVAHLHENIDIAKKYGFKDELERSYKLLSETYFDQGDLNKAYEYQSMYLAVHDSLYDQRNSEQMALMQASFESELKETQIELLTKDAALKANEIKSQKVWLY